jgi:hypothetical protein
MKNERVLASWRRHPFAVVRSAGPWVTLAMVAAVLAGPGPNRPLGGVGFATVLAACWQAADWWWEVVIVTDRNILRISGIVIRKTTLLPVEHITRLTYRRSVAGRLLGYGECVLESAGHGEGPLRLELMPEPDKSYAVLNRALAERAESAERRLSPRSP